MFEKAAYNNVQHMNQNFVKPSLRVIEEFSVCTSKHLFYAVSSLFSTKFAYTPTLSRKFNPLEVIYLFFKAFFPTTRCEEKLCNCCFLFRSQFDAWFSFSRLVFLKLNIIGDIRLSM